MLYFYHGSYVNALINVDHHAIVLTINISFKTPLLLRHHEEV